MTCLTDTTDLRPRMRRCLLLCAFGFLMVHSAAQQVEVTRYDVEQGLPQSMVNHVFQDREGFMWLGTGDGLARFDGTRFVVYKHDPSDSSSLSHNSIWGIAQADPEHLYIGTRTGMDMVHTRTGLFTHVPVGSHKGQNGCWRPLHVSKERALFYSPLTAETLMRSARGWSRQYTRHQGAYCMRTTEQGRILHSFLHPDTLVTLDTWNGKELVRTVSNPAQDRVIDMIRLETGWLMLGERSIWHWKDEGAVQDVPVDLRALAKNGTGGRYIARDKNGELWLGISGTGVILLNPDLSVRQVYPLLHKNEGPLRITAITFDHQGNTWVGTDGKGVFRIAPHRIRFGRAMPGIGSGWQPGSWFVRGFAQWDDHRVLVSFHQGGLAVFNERDDALTALPIEGPMADGTYTQIKRDADGILWMAHEDELLSLEPASGRFMLHEKGMLGRRTLLDRDTVLMVIAAHGIQRYRLRNDKLFREDLEFPLLMAWLDSVHNPPGAAAVDPAGRIWTSGSVTPVEVWSSNGEGQRTRPFPDEVRLNQLMDNGDGSGWICTNNGIYGIRWVDLHITRHVLPGAGLPDRFIYGMVVDGDGRYWLSSNRGLSRISKDLDAIRNYTPDDGLQSMEFNSHAHFRSASGRVYFGGVNGFNHFVPEQIHPDPYAANVVLVRAWAQDSVLGTFGPDGMVELPYPRNRLELEIAVLDMSAAEKATFRYRMKGFQDEWRTTSPNRSLVLERIPAGSFTVEVQGLNADGVPGPVSRLLMVRVQLPFWSTTLFKFLLGGLLAAASGMVMFMVYRQKKNQALALVESEMKDLRMRTRLAKDIHDDVGSGLARMAALSGSPKRISDSAERFDKVNAISSELLANLRDVVWMNDPRHGTLEALLIRLRAFATDLFEETGAVVTCHFPEPVPARNMAGPAVRNLYLIVKEALHNARKYSAAKNVAVHWRDEGDRFVLEVIDDGCGLTTDVPQGGGHGFANMRQRAEELNGTFECISRQGEGTTVRIQAANSSLNG